MPVAPDSRSSFGSHAYPQRLVSTEWLSALTDTLPMGSDYNTRDSVESIHRLRQISHSHNAHIWIPHDPEDWKDFAAPKCYQ